MELVTILNRCYRFRGFVYQQAHFNAGVVEGLNNKAKVTMRKSYGFRTFR